MPYLALRAPRIGFALLLVPLLGTASFAPAPRAAVAVAQPSQPPRLATGRPLYVSAVIPCASGSCHVQIRVPAASAPAIPLPRTTPATPPVLAQR